MSSDAWLTTVWSNIGAPDVHLARLQRLTSNISVKLAIAYRVLLCHKPPAPTMLHFTSPSPNHTLTLVSSQHSAQSLVRDGAGQEGLPEVCRLEHDLLVSACLNSPWRPYCSMMLCILRHCSFSSRSEVRSGSTVPPTMTRLQRERSRSFWANHSARPVRFFTLSSRAIEKIMGLLGSCARDANALTVITTLAASFSRGQDAKEGQREIDKLGSCLASCEFNAWGTGSSWGSQTTKTSAAGQPQRGYFFTSVKVGQVEVAHFEHSLGQGRLLVPKQQLLYLWVQAGQPAVGVCVGVVDVAVCPRTHDVELGIKHIDALHRSKMTIMSSLSAATVC